jgi:hypothetical protein
MQRVVFMRKFTAILISLALLGSIPAHAMNAKYRQQLEKSGCTQVSELQGCDIHKSKAENAKEGYASGTDSAPTASNGSPYSGQWVAKADSGATVATIRIDGKDQVWVNGKKVTAKKSDGALIFRAGMITYTIQGDRRIKGEDIWHDTDVGTKGPINAE